LFVGIAMVDCVHNDGITVVAMMMDYVNVDDRENAVTLDDAAAAAADSVVVDGTVDYVHDDNRENVAADCIVVDGTASTDTTVDMQEEKIMIE
jgi:uncharacterized protein YjhX (UPF0386 family)